MILIIRTFFGQHVQSCGGSNDVDHNNLLWTCMLRLLTWCMNAENCIQLASPQLENIFTDLKNFSTRQCSNSHSTYRKVLVDSIFAQLKYYWKRLELTCSKSVCVWKATYYWIRVYRGFKSSLGQNVLWLYCKTLSVNSG